MDQLNENECVIDIDKAAADMATEAINKFQGDNAFDKKGDLKPELNKLHEKLTKRFYGILYASAIKKWE